MPMPDDSAPTKAAGAARHTMRKSSLGVCPSCGWGRRVMVTGSSDRQAKMAATANRVKFPGPSSRSSCWAPASASRLTTMYTANTWPRRSAVVCSLSQLSITV